MTSSKGNRLLFLKLTICIHSYLTFSFFRNDITLLVLLIDYYNKNFIDERNNIEKIKNVSYRYMIQVVFGVFSYSA